MANVRMGLGLIVTVASWASAAEPVSEPADAALRQRLEEASSAEARADFDAARSIYAKAAETYPRYALAWAALGEHLRFYVHDDAAATAAFRKAIAAEQRDAYAEAYAWRGLGALEAKEHREAEAIALYKKSLDAYPLADTHRSLCHLYCHQRKFKEAAEQAGQAVESNPDDAIARLLYAAQLHRAGEPEKARAEFQRALAAGGLDAKGQSSKPVHCCVLYNSAGYLSVSGQNDAALAMLKRFFETPNHRHLSREEIESDADFDALKELPAFRKLLDVAYGAQDASSKTKPSETR